MKLILLSLLLVLSCLSGYSTTLTVTNSGATFSPSSITITVGDDVNFVLETIHNAVEVSQATWNANGSAALPGGFSTGFGGGLVPANQLGIGTHYYVCTPHASIGMKGTIIVQSTTDIPGNLFRPDFSIYPNPSEGLVTIKAKTNVIGRNYFIIDNAGRKVFEGRLNDETTPVDVSQLARGIYLFQLAGTKKAPVKILKY
jgi:plastocyanin